MEIETRKSLLATAISSLGYMGMIWIMFTNRNLADIYHVVSITYIFLAPFVMGALINHFAPEKERGSFTNLIFKPTLFSILALATAIIIKIEGLICVVMALPTFLIMSTLGAVTHWLIARKLGRRGERRGMVGLLFLPFILGPVENLHQPGSLQTDSKTEIIIDAPAAIVWKNIIRVRKIAPDELPVGLSAFMGFPDPVEATLSHEGVGGVRMASFKGNVLFTEVIDKWIEGEKISFTIAANTKDIPPTTMDEHVIVGGKYFNVLRGTYEIESTLDGKCLLKLSSIHVATTDVNLYADLWGRLVMRDIQNRILKVIKRRCESEKPT